MCLEKYKSLKELPFKCSNELLWTRLTKIFDPNNSISLPLNQLAPEASIAFKILTTNLYTRSGNQTEPSHPMMVALFCSISKIQVNWASLALYNIATNVKRIGGVKHFPRMLSKIFGAGFLSINLGNSNLSCVLQPFTGSSFKRRWLNQYASIEEDSCHLLHKVLVEVQ